MARVLVLDTEEGIKVTECTALEEFYRELKCNVFDIANRSIEGKRFDIFVDDEGLFKENPIVSAIKLNDDCSVEPMLVGNLVIANHNAVGETTDLSDDDIKLIINSTGMILGPNGLQLVLVCDY